MGPGGCGTTLSPKGYRVDCILILANAMHVKALPGRKSDVNDARRHNANETEPPVRADRGRGDRRAQC